MEALLFRDSWNGGQVCELCGEEIAPNELHFVAEFIEDESHDDMRICMGCGLHLTAEATLHRKHQPTRLGSVWVEVV